MYYFMGDGGTLDVSFFLVLGDNFLCCVMTILLPALKTYMFGCDALNVSLLLLYLLMHESTCLGLGYLLCPNS